MFTRRSFLATLAATPLLAKPVFAASPDIFAVDGIAIRGADAIAYFTQSAFVAGASAHALMWKGAEWRFASAQNMTQFEANPDAYAPQYGGYCAYAASKGYVATSVPEAWTVLEGKLYLNYSLKVRDIWLPDAATNIALADASWADTLQS